MLAGAVGCSSTVAHNYPAAIFRSARIQRENGRARAPAPNIYVERAMKDAGLPFGTDGQPTTLYAYFLYAQALVPAAAARTGDVLFFATSPGGRGGCGDHAGVVESVDAGGRITFLESRGGEMRRSFVDPSRPTLRRDARGRVLNTFLRPKRIDDPADARYTAGEMLCAVGRVRDR